MATWTVERSPDGAKCMYCGAWRRWDKLSRYEGRRYEKPGEFWYCTDPEECAENMAVEDSDVNR